MTTTFASSAALPEGLHPIDAHKRVVWGAVLAGMVIAVVLQLLLSLLGAGIGLSTLDPLRANGSPQASSFGVGAALWWALSSLIALFAGGWVAGHLSGSSNRMDAMLHGLLAWGVATLLAVYLLSSLIGSVVRGGASVVGTAATVTASGAAAAAGPLTDAAKQQVEASGLSMSDVKSQVQRLLSQTGNPALAPRSIQGQAASAAGDLTRAEASGAAESETAELQTVLQRIMASGGNAVDQADREAAVNVVMSRAGLDRREAEQRVDGWITSYQQLRVKWEQQKGEAEAKTREVADATAKASSQASLGAALALLLGAIGAALGGKQGASRHHAEPMVLTRRAQ
ncbi:hypothetical protein [Aquincola tertiaricarbonis]|uniref:hypothetical protein n=1 Tax=Aquincola tertiaricarbonis TaxID=391953 RepID=UPI000614EC28|nr:hypothetical protein [Aquincola tertiaricarbonis]